MHAGITAIRLDAETESAAELPANLGGALQQAGLRPDPGFAHGAQVLHRVR